MKNKTRSYARFYALLKRMPGDREEIKRTLVERFSEGRTTSLREMRTEEYEAMCRVLEAEAAHPGRSMQEAEGELKRCRSSVLRRLQKIGIDTTDWGAVDAYCTQPRIAGKRFARLSIDELKALLPKLEAILHKRSAEKQQDPMTPKRIVRVPIFFRPNQIPS